MSCARQGCQRRRGSRVNERDLKGYIRTVADFPSPGIQFRDITSLLEAPAAFAATCAALSTHAVQFAPRQLIAIDSRGFVFASPMALEAGLPLYLARKSGKLPGSVRSETYELEYGEATLELQSQSSLQGRIVIVDDLIATGGTVMACVRLLQRYWGFCPEQILVLAVIDLPDLGGSRRLREAGCSVQTLMSFEGH